MRVSATPRCSHFSRQKKQGHQLLRTKRVEEINLRRTWQVQVARQKKWVLDRDLRGGSRGGIFHLIPFLSTFPSLFSVTFPPFSSPSVTFPPPFFLFGHISPLFFPFGHISPPPFFPFNHVTKTGASWIKRALFLCIYAEQKEKKAGREELGSCAVVIQSGTHS